MRFLKELRDQSAHIAAGTIAILPIALLGPGPLSFAWMTFCMGMMREVTEEGDPVTPGKVLYALRSSKWDLSFWAGAGCGVGLILYGA